MDEIDRSTREIAAISAQMSQLDDGLREKSELLKRQVDEFFMDFAKGRSDLNKRLVTLERERLTIEKGLRLEIGRLQNELAAKEKVIDDRDETLRREQLEHSDLLNKARLEATEARDVTAQRDQTIDELRSDIVSSQERLEQTQRRLDQELNQLELKYTDAAQGRADAEIKLKDAVQRIAQAELSLDDSVAKVQRLTDELTTRGGDLNKLQAELEQSAKEKALLSSNLDRLQLQHEERLEEESKRKQDELEQRSLEFSMQRTSLEAKHDEEMTKLKLDREQIVSRYQEELTHLKRELASLTLELNEKVTTMSTNMSELNTAHEAERSRLESDLVAVREDLRTKVAEARQASEDLKVNLAKVVDDHSKAKETKDKTIDSLQQEIRSYEKIFESMSNQQRSDQSAYSDKVGLLKAQLDEAEKERLAIVTNLRAANEKVMAWEDKYSKKATETSEVYKTAELFEEEKNVLQGEVMAMRQILDESSAEIKELNSSIADLKSRTLDESRERTNAIANQKKLRETLREVEDSRTVLKKELNASRLKYSQLESELRAVKTEALELANSLDRRREKQNEKSEQVQSVKARVLELEADKRTLKQENSALKLKLTERESQLSIKNDSMSGLESKVTRLQRELNKTESTNRTLSEKHALQRSFFEKELERGQVRVERGNGHQEPQSTPSRSDYRKSASVETSVITEGLQALEHEHARLQDKVASLQTLMSEAESFNRNSSGASGHDRLREAQLQAEQLLDGTGGGRSISNRQTTMTSSSSNIESEIIQLRRNLTTSLSETSSQANSPNTKRKPSNGTTSKGPNGTGRSSLNIPKTSTPIARDSQGHSIGLRGDVSSVVDTSKRRLNL